MIHNPTRHYEEYFKYSTQRDSSLAYLEIGKLTESLGANIALVLDLPVLLLKWIIETFVACGASLHLAEIDGLVLCAAGAQNG